MIVRITRTPTAVKRTMTFCFMVAPLCFIDRSLRVTGQCTRNYISGSTFGFSNHAYNVGNTTSVSSVEVIKPPITTVASGR